MKKLLILVSLTIVLAAVGCAAPEPTPIPPTPTPETCFGQTVDYRADTQEIAGRWDDAMAIAGSTGRANLSGPVAALQEIRRETRDIVPPGCAAAAHQAFVDYMDAEIESYIAFMQNKSDNRVNQLKNLAQQAFIKWSDELDTLAE